MRYDVSSLRRGARANQEMAKASMIARRTPSALDLLDLIDPSTPTGIQLLATSADELTRALAVIEEEVRG